MLQNNYHRGSDAHFALEEFRGPMARLEDVIIDQVEAYKDVCEELEDKKEAYAQLEEEIEEREEEIEELQGQVEELTKQLHEAAKPIPNRDEEFLRVLRNISVYVNDSIRTLEARCGYEEQDNTSDSGDRSDASPEDLGYEADK